VNSGAFFDTRVDGVKIAPELTGRVHFLTPVHEFTGRQLSP